MYTPKRTKLQFKIIFQEAPVPIYSSATIPYLCYLNNYIYFLKENVHGKCTPSRTSDKKSGEYAPIPLKMRQNVSKIFSETYQIALF